MLSSPKGFIREADSHGAANRVKDSGIDDEYLFWLLQELNLYHHKIGASRKFHSIMHIFPFCLNLSLSGCGATLFKKK